MHLFKYLDAQFPGLPLAPPLFYNWPIALRFELGDPDMKMPVSEPYFAKLVERANALYESAFSPGDLTFLASEKHYGHKGRSPRLFGSRRPFANCSVFDLARKLPLGIARPSGQTTTKLDRVKYTKAFWAEIHPRRIDYRCILAKIAREDFPVGAGFAGDVFFVNITRGLIFHMYDDRGLDIVAANPQTLQPIVDTHKEWLLTYDLPRMKERFEI